MKIKLWLINFFHFNKQERNGVFILFTIIIFLTIIKLLLPVIIGNQPPIQFIEVNAKQIDETYPENIFHEFNKNNSDSKKISNQKFVFNPNTVSLEDALKLGFSKKLFTTLNNYRNKGGKFQEAEDLKKLFGLSKALYQELEPYILIARLSKKENNPVNTYTFGNNNYQKKESKKALLNINIADSLSLVYLKGIGPGYAKRILKYRNMLGGFHSLEQLKEVYGMTDSLYLLLSNQITINKNECQKIPINSIDINTLRKHPYFNFHNAQAIINYRSKHGLLTEKDIIALGVFNQEKLSLILPYLAY